MRGAGRQAFARGLAGTARVELASARFWRPGAYPLAHPPYTMKTALGLGPRAVALWRLGGLHGNRPSVQGSFKLR